MLLNYNAEKLNPKFYEKFFFVINKIDLHEDYKGAGLEAKINDIRKRIKEGYGYKVPDSHFIGVAAKPGLLYRIDEQTSLDQARKKDFNTFIARFLDLSDVTPESIIEAKNKVLELSNIEALEQALINYLQNSNQARDLIRDAIAKAKMFLQNYEELLKNDLGIFQTKLEDLEQKEEKLRELIKEAERRKDKEVVSQLENGKKKMRELIYRKYYSFGEELKSLIDQTFNNQQQTEKDWLATNTKKLREIVSNLLGFSETKKKRKVKKIINDYNKTLSEVTRDYYTVFEANLKTETEENRKKYYNQAYQNANQILEDLKQEIGDILKITLENRDFVFPALELDSVIDKVEAKVYKKRSKRKKVKEGGTFSDPEYKTVSYYSVDVQTLTNSTKEKIDDSVTNGKKEVKDLLNQDIEDMKNYLISHIDDHINKLRQRLNEAIQKRKTQGFKAQEEIAKLESELELVKEKLTRLNAFAQNI